MGINPGDPKVMSLLNNLVELDLDKGIIKRVEPLVLPHYKLMTLEQLQEVSEY